MENDELKVIIGLSRQTAKALRDTLDNALHDPASTEAVYLSMEQETLETFDVLRAKESIIAAAIMVRREAEEEEESPEQEPPAEEEEPPAEEQKPPAK